MSESTGRRRVAALISEYRLHSHADVIIGRMLKGYWLNGRHHDPRVEVVSMYTDQVPDTDMSRDLAAEYEFKLVPSIRHALSGVADESLGPRELAVDGVVLIAEHGAYPYNPLGQKLYPRWEFYKEVVDVFRETGASVPVFCDKHLSWDWHKARWMYDQAQELGFPFMAGSVLPLAHHPDKRWEMGRPMSHAAQVWWADFVGNKDSYGFHALEELQARVERRAGGETGVKAVQCLEGDPVWSWTDAHPWAGELLQAIAGGADGAPGPLRGLVKDPMAFVLEYADGLEAVVYRLNGHECANEFGALVPGEDEPVVLPRRPVTPSAVHLPDEVKDRYPVANHFAAEVNLIEEMVLTGQVKHPVERTLLTTGVLAALHESTYRRAENYGRTYQHGSLLKEGTREETPHLLINYAPATD